MTVPPSGSQAETERREAVLSAEEVERIAEFMDRVLDADYAKFVHNLARSHEALRARADRLEQALERIGGMAGPGESGQGAAGWILTLEAPAIARAALSAAGQEPDG